MNIRYKNPLINIDDIVKYVNDHKVNYWLTLKLPGFLRTNEGFSKKVFETTKETFLEGFVKNLKKETGDKDGNASQLKVFLTGFGLL